MGNSMQFISTLCQTELAPECMTKTFRYIAIENAFMQRMQLKVVRTLDQLKASKNDFSALHWTKN